jgi:hypothetical protein
MTVQTSTRPRLLDTTVRRMVDAMSGVLNRYSIDILRVSLGLVFLGFGSLKFIPNASPAEEIAERTVATLTVGVINGSSAVLLTAVTEVFIGLTLVTGKFLKTGLAVLAAPSLESCRRSCCSSVICSQAGQHSRRNMFSRTSFSLQLASWSERRLSEPALFRLPASHA